MAKRSTHTTPAPRGADGFNWWTAAPLIIISIVGVYTTYSTYKLNANSSQFSAVTSQITAVQAQNAQTAAVLQQASGRIDAAGQQMLSVVDRLGKMEGHLDAIDTEVTTMSGTLTDMRELLKSIDGKLAGEVPKSPIAFYQVSDPKKFADFLAGAKWSDPVVVAPAVGTDVEQWRAIMQGYQKSQ